MQETPTGRASSELATPLGMALASVSRHLWWLPITLLTLCALYSAPAVAIDSVESQRDKGPVTQWQERQWQEQHWQELQPGPTGVRFEEDEPSKLPWGDLEALETEDRDAEEEDKTGETESAQVGGFPRTFSLKRPTTFGAEPARPGAHCSEEFRPSSQWRQRENPARGPPGLNA